MKDVRARAFIQVTASFSSLTQGSSCPSGVGDAEWQRGERERERQWLWDLVGVDGTFSWDSLGVPAFFYFPAWPDWPSMSSGFAAVLQPWMVHREHERHGWVPEAPVCTGIILEFHCFGVRKRRCCVPLSHAALPACRNYCKWWFIKSL